MKTLTYKDNDLLIEALLHCYNTVPDTNSLCEDGATSHNYLLSYIEKELEPLLDNEFRIAIENHGIFDFRYKSNVFGDTKVYNIFDIESMKKVD